MHDFPTKQCRLCRTTLPLDSYTYSKRSKDLRHSDCRECLSIINKFNARPDKVMIHELPKVYKNRIILTTLFENTKSTFKTENPEITVEVDLTNRYIKATILKNDSLEGQIHFSETDTQMCLQWLVQYLNKNEIWLIENY